MAVFETIRTRGILFDSVLTELTLMPNERKELIVKMKVDSPKGRYQIVFEGVKRFEFSHYSGYVFYNFDNTKLYDVGDEYYFSFDPSEDDGISKDDGDILVCSKLMLKKL